MKPLYSQPAAGAIRIMRLPTPTMYDCTRCGTATAAQEIPLADGKALCGECAAKHQQEKKNE